MTVINGNNILPAFRCMFFKSTNNIMFLNLVITWACFPRQNLQIHDLLFNANLIVRLFLLPLHICLITTSSTICVFYLICFLFILEAATEMTPNHSYKFCLYQFTHVWLFVFTLKWFHRFHNSVKSYFWYEVLHLM